MTDLRKDLVKARAKRKRAGQAQARIAMGTAFSEASSISGPSSSAHGTGASSVTLPPVAVPAVLYDVLPPTIWTPGDVPPPLQEYGGVQVLTADAPPPTAELKVCLSCFSVRAHIDLLHRTAHFSLGVHCATNSVASSMLMMDADRGSLNKDSVPHVALHMKTCTGVVTACMGT
jgi:hypothetical protein